MDDVVMHKIAADVENDEFLGPVYRAHPEEIIQAATTEYGMYKERERENREDVSGEH
ncbi:hypothetical protein [Pseudoscardovia suis]